MGQCLTVPEDEEHENSLARAEYEKPPPASLVFGYERTFNDKYRTGKELGRGMFGVTYAATDKSSGEKVAVKVILKKTLVHEVDIEDTRREVEILRALQGHENVVHFIGAYEDVDKVYIVMELCEGGELLDRILAKRDRHYSEKEAAAVVRQMLNVVARCHLFGVAHRDIKPENFLFKDRSEESPLRATDFGLSAFLQPGKKFRSVVGSAYYVAPEVLNRRSGAEADVWSIGVTTYILLCGRRPFWDKTDNGIFREVLKAKPDFKSNPWPSISPAAKDFVKKLLNKNPKARLTAAQALSHPWVREGGHASDLPLDISVLDNLRSFVRYSRLKQLVLRALATTLRDSELVDLKDQFQAIDVNNKGTVTIEEIRKVLTKNRPYVARKSDLSEQQCEELLAALDNDKDGMVDFKEFAAASMHLNQLRESESMRFDERVKQAFDSLDNNKDGVLSADELKVGMGIKGEISDLLKEGDENADGQIDLKEFRRIVSIVSRLEGEGPLVRQASLCRSPRPQVIE